jgi:hypothetical protein
MRFKADLDRDGLFNPRQEYSGPLRALRLGSTMEPETPANASGVPRAAGIGAPPMKKT